MTHKFALKPGVFLINPDNKEERFLIKEVINQGGFSFIYEADMIHFTSSRFIEEREVNRKEVVIKELYYPAKASRSANEVDIIWKDELEEDALSKKIKNKTLSEAFKLSGLSSPNILYIYSALEINNTVYIVTKKISGAQDFSKKLNLNTANPIKLNVKDTIKYIRQVCNALQQVHDKNIIHLDIKPENILLDDQGNAILIDFGISVSLKENRAETVLGAVTPHYSPPEQSSKDKINFATDIYALGCTMYVFLTGKLVPEHHEIASGTENLVAPSHYNEEISPYLDEVILKSINLKRDERYQTVGEFLNAIQNEKQYNNLLDSAKKEFAQKNFSKAIDLLSQTENFIPPTEDVQELLVRIRKEYEGITDKKEFEKQLAYADQLVLNKKYIEAIEIFRSLPQNIGIQNKIKIAEELLKKEKIKKLRLDALSFENSGNTEKAIEKYQALFLLDNNNFKISHKIDALQSVILEEQKFQMHLEAGKKLLNTEDYNSAFTEFSLALKYKPNDTVLNKKLEYCIENIELQNSYNTDLEKVIVLDNKVNITDEELLLLEKLKENYPTNTYIIKVYERKNDEIVRQKAVSQFNSKNYTTAKNYFISIKNKTKEDQNYLKEIEIHEQISAFEDGKQTINFEFKKTFLLSISSSSIFYDRAQTQLQECKFQEGVRLHQLKKYVDAKILFSEIRENTQTHWNAQQYLKFYSTFTALENGNIDKARAILETINYHGLKDDIEKIKTEIESNNKTRLLDDKLLKDAQRLIDYKDFPAALVELNKIVPSSALCQEAQQLKTSVEKEIAEEKKKQDNTIKILGADNEQEYKTLLVAAQTLFNQKKYVEAKEKVSSIPITAKMYAEVRSLLEEISILENKPPIDDTTTSSKAYVKYAVLGGITVLGYFGYNSISKKGDVEATAVEETRKPPEITTEDTSAADEIQSVKDHRVESFLPEFYDYYLYTGKMKDGLSNDTEGEGKYYKDNICISTYKGSYVNGKRQGKGTSTETEEAIKLLQKGNEIKQVSYEGEFTNDQPEGKGKAIFKDGNYMEGTFNGYMGKPKVIWYDKYGKKL